MRRLSILFAACAALGVLTPRRAHAVNCADLPGEKIYAQVGDTQLNLMKRLGRALRDNAPKPITLVFLTSGSCTNIAAIYTRVAITASMQYVPSVAEDPAWTPASATLACTIPAGAGPVPDLAGSALFNSACTTDPPPATVHLEEGPKQAYVLAVPTASEQNAITFEEAYFVFGFGMPGMVQPWIDETQLFIRTVTKSTLLAWAANIGVPGAKWKGVRFDGSPQVVTALQTSVAPKAAIGILGAEVYDANRATLKSLAFRAKGQYAAYFADSTSSSRDKKNLRDGHYTVWSPTVWMDTVDAGGAPVVPDTRYVIDLIAGKTVTPAPSFDMIDIIAAVGLVPDCAMGVKRAFEGGPLSLYSPAESCVCKYESLVDTSSCTTCTDTCAAGVCRGGYCEVQ
jgi:hypothetical protein